MGQVGICVPLEGDYLLVCHAGLFVKNLEVHQETSCQACHNGIVDCNTIVVTFGLESLLEDEIAIGVEGDHDVLVPQVCPDRTAGSVICVQPAEGVHLDEGLIGWHSCGSGAAVGSAGSDEGLGCLGLVDLTFWRCWARCPKIVLLASGQYLATLEYVSPLKVSHFPALMASNHVCLTGMPRHTW